MALSWDGFGKIVNVELFNSSIEVVLQKSKKSKAGNAVLLLLKSNRLTFS